MGGRFLRMDIPMSVRIVLILWHGYGAPDANFVEFPWQEWIFRDLPVLVAGMRIYSLIGAGVCL